MKPRSIPFVPEQFEGGFHDTETKIEISPELVDEKFEILKSRFHNINSWKEISSVGASEFKLYSKDGTPVSRSPLVGDKMRIDVPGPSGTKSHYDWVDIIDYQEFESENKNEFSILFTSRPTDPPENEKENYVAHFYGKDATSTTMITKGKNYLVAGVHGRNEIPNTKKANWLDAIRNFLFATGGVLGAGKIQWKLLTDGLVADL
ncbi:MAG TPA: hypothetical protein VKY36_00060 [Moheibacter sp.]|nr:hypothetical protein [Moheibacter sp.]